MIEKIYDFFVSLPKRGEVLKQTSRQGQVIPTKTSKFLMLIYKEEVLKLKNRSVLKCTSAFREFLDSQGISYDQLSEELEATLESEMF